MFNKKLAAIVVVISFILGIKFSKIYVPDGFEKPFVFKLMSSFVSFGMTISKLAADFKIGDEVKIFRVFLGNNPSPPNYSDEFLEIYGTKLNDVAVRVYKPKNSEKKNKPILVFYHGGGYVFGDTYSYDHYLSRFVRELEMVVVSVDFRMGPEHPYPIPIDECYSATLYVLKNAKEFDCDPKKVIIAGDSAGGHAAAVVSQRLLENKQPQPKLQILIYPWTQMVNTFTASNIYYKQKSAVPIPFAKIVSWYLGIKDIKQEILEAFVSNNHSLLFDDYEKYLSLMNINKISNKYKIGRSYYENYESKIKQYLPKHKLDKTNILIKDKKINSLFKQLSNKDFSPLFAEDKCIIGLPKAYFVLLEWDAIKDEGLLYAERLKEKGVEVKIAFYENAFHGIINLIDIFEIAKKMQTDLINYLKSNL